MPEALRFIKGEFFYTKSTEIGLLPIVSKWEETFEQKN